MIGHDDYYQPSLTIIDQWSGLGHHDFPQALDILETLESPVPERSRRGTCRKPNQGPSAGYPWKPQQKP